jgi:hypothetical protein
MTRRALNLGDSTPRRNVDDPRELGDPTKLVLVEPAEKRHSLQMSDPRIAAGLRRSGACRLCLIGLIEG